MSKRDWLLLSDLERAILINGMEGDLLPGVLAELNTGDASADDYEVDLDAVRATLISYVDRGLVEVCRYEDVIDRDGRVSLKAGTAVPRSDLESILLDLMTWRYPKRSIVGGCCHA